jgi:hypothetical protein
LSNKPGVAAIKNSFFVVAIGFVLFFYECYHGQPVGAGWTAYVKVCAGLNTFKDKKYINLIFNVF